MSASNRKLHVQLHAGGGSSAASSPHWQQPQQVQEFEDGRTHDPNAVRSITQKWLDDHMKFRESEFTEKITASIFCGTWNVNAKKQDGSLVDWLKPDGTATADVYAVGFQEIVDLNAMNVALDSSKSQNRTNYWREQISDCLQSADTRYQLVMERHLVGLLLCIFVKVNVVPFVKDVRAAHLACGIMGMMGNKGGVSVRMSLYDSSVCFVCAHLAAHRENVEGRNSDYKSIIERTVFTASSSSSAEGLSRDRDDLASLLVRPRHGASRTIGVDLSVPDHEVIFWLGDLNYRIDGDLSTEEVFSLIEREELSTLRAMDQLNIERAKGRAFVGFQEGELMFAPTYKYQPGTDEYEKRPEKKLRAPAWCDRVLWRTNDGISSSNSSVRLRQYRRSGLMPSDHKPVSALFDCDVRVVVKEREDAVYRALMNNLEFWKNETATPAVTLNGESDVLVIDMDTVQYEIQAEYKLQIKNVGKSLAHWHFIPKLEETRICKRWVEVSCTKGLLFPDEVEDVTITVKVDRSTAQMINTGRGTLDDVLVLRVENSKDFYLPVTTDYQRSCYGVSLEELVYTHGPIRRTRIPAASNKAWDELTTANTGANAATTTQSRMSVPKELWRLVDALWSSGALRERDLFASHADAGEVAAIRNALDCSIEFPRASSHAYAEALVSFLQALARPIIPTDMIPTSDLDPQSLKPWCRRFLETLPPLNYNVLVYVLSFLREVLQSSEYNRCTASKLSLTCVSCLTTLGDDTAATVVTGSVSSSSLKEEKTKREQRQIAAQKIIEYLLSTPSL